MKVYSQDERNIVSDAERGTYYVRKTNTVAQFSFGVTGTFATAKKAFDAMQQYIVQRKDSAKLRVQVVEFE